MIKRKPKHRYAITGHTRGLGKELYSMLPKDTLGFSTANKHDISDPVGRLRIAELSKDCDVFINCAFDYTAPFAQAEMLYEMYQHWENESKLIINIGSDATSGIKTAKPRMYIAGKAALDKLSEQMSWIKSPVHVTNFKFGYVWTDDGSYDGDEVWIDRKEAARFIIDHVDYALKYNLTELLIRASQ